MKLRKRMPSHNACTKLKCSTTTTTAIADWGRVSQGLMFFATVLKTRKIPSKGQPDHQIKYALLQGFHLYTLLSNTSNQEKKVNYYL